MVCYQIQQESRTSNPILPISYPKNLWGNKEPIFIPALERKKGEYAYTLPIIIFQSIHANIFVVSDKVKEIIKPYQNDIEYRPCAIGRVEEKDIGVYWFINPPQIECIDETTEKKGLDISKLVLNREMIAKNKVFCVRIYKKINLYMEREVVEAILSEGINGFQFIEIETV